MGKVSNIGFIMVHGLNEGPIAPYTDIEFQMAKYQTYIIMKSQDKDRWAVRADLEGGAAPGMCPPPPPPIKLFEMLFFMTIFYRGLNIYNIVKLLNLVPISKTRLNI